MYVNTDIELLGLCSLRYTLIDTMVVPLNFTSMQNIY